MTDHWTGKRRREILFLDCVTLDDFESYIHPLSALDFFFPVYRVNYISSLLRFLLTQTRCKI